MRQQRRANTDAPSAVVLLVTALRQEISEKWGAIGPVMP